jgi:hypothetical protein
MTIGICRQDVCVRSGYDNDEGIDDAMQDT